LKKTVKCYKNVHLDTYIYTIYIRLKQTLVANVVFMSIVSQSMTCRGLLNSKTLREVVFSPCVIQLTASIILVEVEIFLVFGDVSSMFYDLNLERMYLNQRGNISTLRTF